MAQAKIETPFDDVSYFAEGSIDQEKVSVATWSPPFDNDRINMMEIPWFHPNLTRHQAEAELANCEEGIYLLRPCMLKEQKTESYSLDVKCAHSVKHFKVDILNNEIEFGQEIFPDINSFLTHFDNRPLIGDDTGLLTILKYSYPRDVDEIHDYQSVTEHFLSGIDRRKQEISQTRAYSRVSKEGYLTKMGAIVKSWKNRWFVLKNNELHYYAREKDREPIKSIDLRFCSEVAPCEISSKSYVFRLVLPQRTFYLQAPNASVMNEWISILNWKISELQGR